MNAGVPANDASQHYYDGDYPSESHGLHPENFDEVTVYQGLRHDVPRYVQLAQGVSGPVLELCCGTGRVAIPLAKAGHAVWGVDLSATLLGQFHANLARQSADVRARVTLVEQDVTRLALPRKDFALAICAFNSLLCITDFAAQREALRAVRRHLAADGRLVLDVVNPLRLSPQGDPVPKAFFTRKSPHDGATYTRFAMTGPFDAENRQKLHGWYDELSPEGVVSRRHYDLTWRPIHRHELELMLETAGFRLASLEGGHQGEPYGPQSPRMLVVAEVAP